MGPLSPLTWYSGARAARTIALAVGRLRRRHSGCGGTEVECVCVGGTRGKGVDANSIIGERAGALRFVIMGKSTLVVPKLRDAA